MTDFDAGWRAEYKIVSVADSLTGPELEIIFNSQLTQGYVYETAINVAASRKIPGKHHLVFRNFQQGAGVNPFFPNGKASIKLTSNAEEDKGTLYTAELFQ